MSAIKSPVLFGLSMLLAIAVLWFVADRTLFMVRSQHSTGAVVAVTGQNGRCSCGRRCHYDCTRFHARVDFNEQRGTQPLVVGAGSAHGYNRPLSLAMYGVGDHVPVVYNPHNTDEAYRDSFADVWGTPLTVFFFQLVTLFGSFTSKRHP